MAGLDPFASVTAAVLDLLTRDGDVFLSLGTNLFRDLAVILIVGLGIQTALGGCGLAPRSSPDTTGATSKGGRGGRRGCPYVFTEHGAVMLASVLRSPVAMNAIVGINESSLTVAEVAARLKVNEETVRRLFLNEPGVIVICFPRRGKRVYRTVRIPEAVFQRVLTRFTR